MQWCIPSEVPNPSAARELASEGFSWISMVWLWAKEYHLLKVTLSVGTDWIKWLVHLYHRNLDFLPCTGGNLKGPLSSRVPYGIHYSFCWDGITGSKFSFAQTEVPLKFWFWNTSLISILYANLHQRVCFLRNLTHHTIWRNIENISGKKVEFHLWSIYFLNDTCHLYSLEAVLQKNEQM